jgi:Xaa-Pro aminopeptidase
MPLIYHVIRHQAAPQRGPSRSAGTCAIASPTATPRSCWPSAASPSITSLSTGRWVQRFTPEFIEAARFRRHAPGDRWFDILHSHLGYRTLDYPETLEEGMVFALETYWPGSDGWSAARIEEELVVTADAGG